MKEEWRTIKDTDNKYSVSNLGNVRRNEHYTVVSPTKQHFNGAKVFYKERNIKKYLDTSGYEIVYLQMNDKRIIKKVHRLVAESFIPNTSNFPFVNHIDENKLNNCVDNLEWCTAKHNANHGTRNQKLQIISGIKVAQYDLDGNLIKIWDSLSQAAKSFGTKTTSGIRRVCKKEKGRNTYKGFIWKYADQKIIGSSSLKDQMIKNKNELIKMIFTILSKEDRLQVMKMIQLENK